MIHQDQFNTRRVEQITLAHYAEIFSPGHPRPKIRCFLRAALSLTNRGCAYFIEFFNRTIRGLLARQIQDVKHGRVDLLRIGAGHLVDQVEQAVACDHAKWDFFLIYDGSNSSGTAGDCPGLAQGLVGLGSVESMSDYLKNAVMRRKAYRELPVRENPEPRKFVC